LTCPVGPPKSRGPTGALEPEIRAMAEIYTPSGNFTLQAAVEGVVNQTLNIPGLIDDAGKKLGWYLVSYESQLTASLAPVMNTTAIQDQATIPTVYVFVAAISNCKIHVSGGNQQAGFVSKHATLATVTKSTGLIVQVNAAEIDLGTVGVDDLDAPGPPITRYDPFGLLIVDLNIAGSLDSANDKVLGFIDNGITGSGFPFMAPGSNVKIQIASTGLFNISKPAAT